MLLTRKSGALALPGLGELSWLPFLDPAFPIEEYRKDDKLVVRAELPGINPAKDVAITTQDGGLRIVVVRLKENHAGGHSEFHYGTHYRTVILPPGTKEDSMSAKDLDGILEITMTVAEPEHTVRTIPVAAPDRQPKEVKKSQPRR